jgi:AraC-like DNA-binding protein
MRVRAATAESRSDIVRRVRTMLDGDPTLSLDAIADELGWCSRNIQRAFRLTERTCFRDEQQARRLDRAALSLIDDGVRFRHSALLRAAQVAGFKRTRHLAAPFRSRFGVTPSVAWRAASLIASLEVVASTPPPRSPSKQYSARRRKWRRQRDQLRRIALDATPGSLLAVRLDEALTMRRTDFRKRRAASPRCRARRHSRSRRRPQ